MRQLSVLVILLLFSACNSEKTNDRGGKTIVTGVIHNPDNHELSDKGVLYTEDIMGGAGRNSIDFSLEDDGSFYIETTLSGPQDFGLQHNGGVQLYLGPNDSLHLDITLGKDESIEWKNVTYSGDRAQLNEQLNRLADSSPLASSNYYEKIGTLSPEEFKPFHDSVMTAYNTYMDESIADPNTPSELKDWLRVEQKYTPLNSIAQYDMYYTMYSRKPRGVRYMDASFYAPLETLPVISESDYANIKAMSRFSKNYYYNTTDKLVEGKDPKTIDRDSLIVHGLNASISNPVLKQVMYYQHYKGEFDNYNIAPYEKYKSVIDPIFAGGKFEKLIQDNYLATKEKIENPVLPAKAKLLTFKSDNPEDYLDEIIKKANGKILYIDNWATWCGPCKNEFKHYTKPFKEKYPDLEYVYLCYRSKEPNWKPTIAEYAIEGDHYFLNDEEAKVMRKEFDLKGFPTYAVIDGDGKMVVSSFKYRPSAEATATVIDSLLAL